VCACVCVCVFVPYACKLQAASVDFEGFKACLTLLAKQRRDAAQPRQPWDLKHNSNRRRRIKMYDQTQRDQQSSQHQPQQPLASKQQQQQQQQADGGNAKGHTQETFVLQEQYSSASMVCEFVRVNTRVCVYVHACVYVLVHFMCHSCVCYVAASCS